MPEEINRITADHLSTVLFPPTENGHQQLLKEGIAAESIFNVGDVMYDATLFYNEYNAARQTIVETLKLQPKSYCLATIHRAENTDDEARLKNICNAFIELSKSTRIVLPLHPRTRGALSKMQLLDVVAKHVILIDPVGYLDMLALEKYANTIITDSGGVQKEAYFNHVPCITLRNETEWLELVDSGWNQLCSPDKPFSLLDFKATEKNLSPNKCEKLYGNGDSAEQIVKILC